MRNNRNQVLSLAFIILAICSLTLGYAAFTQTFNIDFGATVQSGQTTWDIYFESNGKTPTKTGYAEVGSMNLNRTTMDITGVMLKLSGDSVTYSANVVNNGDIDAKISFITLNTPTATGGTTAEQQALLNGIVTELKYADGTYVKIEDTLASKETKEILLTIKLNSNVTIPNNDITIDNLGCTVTYIQDGGYISSDEQILLGNSLVPALIRQSGTSSSTTEGFKNNSNGIYTYTGKYNIDKGTNWLWYGGHLWRIMTADSNTNEVTLITAYPLLSITWGSSGTDVVNTPSLETSYVGKWLNDVFVPSLPIDVQNSLQPMTYIKSIYSDGKQISDIATAKVRLLSKVEYLGAGDETSYLNIFDHFWLADVGVNTVYCTELNGGNYTAGSYMSYGVRPVIEVSNLRFKSGDGTLENPYTVVETMATITSEMNIGDYVSIPKNDGSTYLARVIKHDQYGTKVTLNGIYSKGSFGSSVTFSRNSTIYTNSLASFKNTLDLNYFDSTYKNFLIGTYATNSYYSLNTYVSTDIGLPSIGEMFTGNDIDINVENVAHYVDKTKVLNYSSADQYWTMNAYNTKNVRTAAQSGNMSSSLPSSSNIGIRPTWYIKSGNITGGSGTAYDPYTLK